MRDKRDNMLSTLESFLQAIPQYTFLQNALLAVVLISIIAGIIGSLLVSNHIVFVGGGVAHCAYGGIGVAIFLGFSVLLGASISALIVAFSLAFVQKRWHSHIDTFNAILWALGMSVGIVFMNLSPSANADMESYLFGSLISVDLESLLLMGGFDIILIFFVIIYYREIISVSYDCEFCELRGLYTNIFTQSIFAFIAIGIILSMQISGLILVLAMLSIPAYIGNIFAKTLKMQMFFAGIFALIFMLVGLFLAYAYNIMPGAAITFVGTICMISVHLCKWLLQYIVGG